MAPPAVPPQSLFPQYSADANQWWGQDLQLDATGDIATVIGLDRDNQRIFRRLMTNGSRSGAQIGEYFFHPDYGGSAGWYVGQTTAGLLLDGVIRFQMYMEQSVSQSPEPVVTTTWDALGNYTATIQYTNNNTGERVPPLEMTVTS